jgi:hypothetical protein
MIDRHKYGNYDCFKREMYQLIEIITMDSFENSKIEQFQRDATKEILEQLKDVNPDCLVMLFMDLWKK